MDEFQKPTTTVASENLEFVAKIEDRVGNAGNAEVFREIAARCRILELNQMHRDEMRHALDLMPRWSFIRRSKLNRRIIDQEVKNVRGWMQVYHDLTVMKKWMSGS